MACPLVVPLTLSIQGVQLDAASCVTHDAGANYTKGLSGYFEWESVGSFRTSELEGFGAGTLFELGYMLRLDLNLRVQKKLFLIGLSTTDCMF